MSKTRTQSYQKDPTKDDLHVIFFTPTNLKNYAIKLIGYKLNFHVVYQFHERVNNASNN